MKKAVITIVFSVISSLAFSQTLINPVAHKLEDTQYQGSPKSFDAYLKNNDDKCTKRVAEQMIKLKNDKNAEFLKYSNAIGAKLKKVDDRCNFFRFEIIDYIEDSFIDIRFAYRCYATKAGTLPHQRVSHIDPLVINPGIFYRNKDLINEECDALAIIKQLNEKPAKTQSGGKSTTTPYVSPKSSGSSTKSKKVPVQN